MAQFQKPLNITVLSGGPDAEAMISHKSAAAISEALRTAGHHVNEMDLPTDDPSSPLRDIPQDHVVFPALHGPWGEGGGAQSQLVELGLPFVGFCPMPRGLRWTKIKPECWPLNTESPSLPVRWFTEVAPRPAHPLAF